MRKKMKRFVCAAAAIITGLLSCCQVFAAVDTSAVFELTSNTWEKWPQAPDIQGDTAVVMDLDTGAVLYDKGKDAERYPASITKIMTSLLILENCSDMNAQVTMTETGMADAYSGSSNVNPTLGEVFTVEQCLQMILVKSANDVATQMAEYVGGSVQGFVDMMNAKAAELGCTHTHFCNASGLENDDHYTSPYDMALITREALKHDKFREIIGLQNITIPATNTSGARYYDTHIQMIVPGNQYYYEGCIGGKTGYTDISKSTLVAVAERDGHTLIGVVMGGTDSNLICTDMIAILDYGFQNFSVTDMSYGLEMISGGTAMVPNGTEADAVEIQASRTDGGIQLTYLYSGQTLGGGLISEEGYKQLKQEREVTADFEDEPEESQETQNVTVTATPEAEQPEENGDRQETGNSILPYVIMGVLGILILGGVILIVVGSRRNRKGRRR